jgi:chromosomal replication initiation ATPase DnaA
MNIINYYAVPGLIREGFKKNPENIIELVCEKTGVPWKKIKGSRGKDEILMARHMCTYLLLKYTNVTQVEVGKLINRKHSGISRTQKKFIDHIYTNKEISQKIEEISRIIENKLPCDTSKLQN